MTNVVGSNRHSNVFSNRELFRKGFLLHSRYAFPIQLLSFEFSSLQTFALYIQRCYFLCVFLPFYLYQYSSFSLPLFLFLRICLSFLFLPSHSLANSAVYSASVSLPFIFLRDFLSLIRPHSLFSIILYFFQIMNRTISLKFSLIRSLFLNFSLSLLISLYICTCPSTAQLPVN